MALHATVTATMVLICCGKEGRRRTLPIEESNSSPEAFVEQFHAQTWSAFVYAIVSGYLLAARVRVAGLCVCLSLSLSLSFFLLPQGIGDC